MTQMSSRELSPYDDDDYEREEYEELMQWTGFGDAKWTIIEIMHIQWGLPITYGMWEFLRTAIKCQ